jgi:hypothetical protein
MEEGAAGGMRVDRVNGRPRRAAAFGYGATTMSLTAGRGAEDDNR